MNQPLVLIENLTKIVDEQTILKDISAQVEKGKIVALAGPDGAGKTTFLRLIAALLLPTEGKITLDGHDTVEESEFIHESIGYMPQKFGLYQDLTVMQNLTLYADLKGVESSNRKETFEKLLSFTSLEPFTDRLAGKLSGGMKQKLGLACTLLSKPTLLLLDEPTVGVDPISRRELWSMVQELLKDGISVLWSTAYLDEAEKCDQVLLLSEGALLFVGPPQEIMERVKGKAFFVKNFDNSKRKTLMTMLGMPNVIDGTIVGNSLRIVVKEEKEPLIEKEKINGGEKIEFVPTEEKFEDAFMDILGGVKEGHSLLAERTEEKKGEEEILVEAKELTKMFGKFTAADNITFEIGKGEVFGLLGPNGAGKSTTFKMLCGLLKPTSGEAFVGGVSLLKAASEARSRIGYMAQKFSLYGDLSVSQNLHFFSGAYNLTGEKRKEKIEQMIEIFHLQPILSQTAGSLPLGFKQRLSLACSVMHEPEILFLDEPTAGVDPITRREFWTHIDGLVEKGVTVMITTHFLDEAENCDRIALIHESKLITIGSPEELKEKAKSEENSNPTLDDAFVYWIKSTEGKDEKK